MTNEQRILIQAARLELENQALSYALVVSQGGDGFKQKERLAAVAKNFTRVVDSVDPTLWELVECCPSQIAKSASELVKQP